MAFRAEGFCDYSPSAFQPDESRAEQVARANAWSRHAACYRKENRNGDADRDSSCGTRRAGSTRGSSLTLGKVLDEGGPKISGAHFPAELGAKHGSGVATVDGHVLVRLRALYLGARRYSLEGSRYDKGLHALFAV